VTATDHEYKYDGRDPEGSFLKDEVPHTEEHVIRSVSMDGRTLILSAGLKYAHRGGDDSAELRGEVANLTRNVIVESTDPNGVRGHTMFHKGGAAIVGYTEIRHLGKRGLLGRYPLHYHLAKDTMRGSELKGNAIWGSENRWVVIHGSEYIVIRDNVAYKALGHGYFLEDGSEVYNLFWGNLGVQALMTDPIEGQALEYDTNDGACYWAANARNFVINNVFAECDNNDSFTLDYPRDGEDLEVKTLLADGSRKTIAVNRIAGGMIKGLEVHSHHGWGPWIRGGDFPEHDPLRLEDVKVWDVHYSIDISGANVVVDRVKVFDSSYGFYNLYPGPHAVRNAYMENVTPHGAFMTYLGGHGTMVYENLTLKSTELVFRMTAKEEEGEAGRPIIIHARNFKVLDPVFPTSSGMAQTHWIGTEDDNVRGDPLLMLVMHDMFGHNRDAVILPQKQSSREHGVPEGLNFLSGHDVKDKRGIGFSGRGDMKVAQASVDWPVSPLLRYPVDRNPPATVILRPQAGEQIQARDGSVRVSGVVLEQSVGRVTVNGETATLDPDGIGWWVTLRNVPAGPFILSAVAADRYGNKELIPHTLKVTVLH
ncbi:MAG: hypothetical protein ACREXR_08710, partial [Gammaproteobacteria bacterium]